MLVPLIDSRCVEGEGSGSSVGDYIIDVSPALGPREKQGRAVETNARAAGRKGVGVWSRVRLCQLGFHARSQLENITRSNEVLEGSTANQIPA